MKRIVEKVIQKLKVIRLPWITQFFEWKIYQGRAE